MQLKKTFFGFIGAVVISASAHAETPLFTTGSTVGLLGQSSDWTQVTFQALSSIGPAVFTYTLLPEWTSAASTQTFSVNNQIIFAGSAQGGATATSAGAITLSSFAFNSHVGGNHSVSTTVGNRPAVDHSGAYKIYESISEPTNFALAYEDDYRSNRATVDYNDMTVRLSVAAVPEPETYAMMIGGLAALGFVGRRRRPV